MTTYRHNENGMYALYTSADYKEITSNHEWKESASVTNEHLLRDDYQQWFNHELECITFTPTAVPKPQWTNDDKRQCYVENVTQEDWERDNNHQSADEWAEHTGLSVGYYDVVIPANSHTNHEHNQPNDVVISCNDIIEALNMNYACGNVFKAIWRICAAKMGKTKKGNNCKYDAEKAVFFSKRVLEQEGEG